MEKQTTSLQRIKNMTGRKPSQCDCELCKKQCKTPCLGTPDDILNLIEAGYISKLRLTGWATGYMLKKAPIITMVQPIITDEGYCIFFKNGLCELHDSGLKPIEGKLSHHNLKLDNYIFEISLSWAVAREWLDPRNFLTKLKVFAFMTLYDAMKEEDNSDNE